MKVKEPCPDPQNLTCRSSYANREFPNTCASNSLPGLFDESKIDHACSQSMYPLPLGSTPRQSLVCRTEHKVASHRQRNNNYYYQVNTCRRPHRIHIKYIHRSNATSPPNIGLSAFSCTVLMSLHENSAHIKLKKINQKEMDG